MNNIRKYTAWLGAGAVMITLATGCADKNNNGQPDSVATNNEIAGSTENMADAAGNTTSNMADAAGNVADAAGNKMDNAGTAMANGAETAADATGNAVSGAGKSLSNLADAATMTPKVKTALGANAALKGSDINVDTLGSKDSIALRGTVTSMAQKTLAESIAKKEAPDYKIINQLTMKGGKM